MQNKLKTCLLAIIIFVINVQVATANKKLYVFAESGLILRDSPSQWGKQVDLIPFGEQVEVLALDKNEPLGTPVEVQEITDFVISGHWKKVNYKNQIGYVFEGYLSPFPAPKLALDEPISEDRYFDEIIGGGTEKYNVLKSKKSDSEQDEIYGYEQSYNLGIQRIVRYEEFAGDVEIIIPEISLQEAYLLSRALYFPPDDTMEYKFDKNYNKITLELKEPDAGCNYSIECFGTGVRIKYTCGC